MPYEVYLACMLPDGGICATTYHLLSTVIDVDGLYDLLEMKEVAASASDAAQRNAEEDARRQEALGGR